MKLKRRRSANVEDRRGMGSTGGGMSFPGLGGGSSGGGGGLPIPIGTGGGIGLIVLIIVLAVCAGPQIFGGDGEGDTTTPLDPDDKLFGFVNAVVIDVNETWTDIFAESDQRYEVADTIVFDGSTPTRCGPGTTATGPFYCPADSQIYLDLAFFRALSTRFGAPGDFAQAYVIAHEYGHHVQNLLGTNAKVQRMSQQDPGRANDLSIRLELQADCLAGVWGHASFADQELSPGDLQEGLAAAESVGDDNIQETTTGRIDPESWTHGSSEQRVRWFQIGFDSGDPKDCDTFQANPL